MQRWTSINLYDLTQPIYASVSCSTMNEKNCKMLPVKGRKITIQTYAFNLINNDIIGFFS